VSEAENINSLICFVTQGTERRTEAPRGIRRCRRYAPLIRPHPNIILAEPIWDTATG